MRRLILLNRIFSARFTRRFNPLSIMMACAFLSLSGLASCSAPPKNLVKPGPPIRGLSLNGGYDCIHFGYMKLRQSGNTVRGTFEGVRRNGDNGTLVGKIEGDIVWLDWVQPGNIEQALLPTKGKGYWRISQRGARLEGKWGYDESRDDGGLWVADRSEFSE